ncbi:hypothetical protein A9Z07_17295 [Acinetobacter sp. YK3]|nr:hypothetical protein A9Z07_17295 [Acinetobacter sp. YK3]
MQLPLEELKDTVNLEMALNQVNANDIHALQDYPIHNISAYTDWAINSESTQVASKQRPILIDKMYCWGSQLILLIYLI